MISRVSRGRVSGGIRYPGEGKVGYPGDGVSGDMYPRSRYIPPDTTPQIYPTPSRTTEEGTTHPTEMLSFQNFFSISLLLYPGRVSR